MKLVRAGLAAAAAAMIMCCQSGTATQAQTAGKPETQAKPAAKPPAKPKAQTTPKQTAAQPVPGRKSVCVASALGHRFNAKKIGLMVFGNSLDEVAIESWGIDDAAARTVAQMIGKDFNVRRIPVPKDALAQFETPQGGWFRDSYSELIRATAAASAKCDVYVLLTRSASNYNGTNQYIAGLGILDSSPLLDRLFVFANFTVRVYDDNLAVLKTVAPTSDFLSLMAAPRAMYRQVDRSWWPTPAQAAVQNAQLKNATRALVEEGLAKTLPAIFEGS